jgi:hypothetical protein
VPLRPVAPGIMGGGPCGSGAWRPGYLVVGSIGSPTSRVVGSNCTKPNSSTYNSKLSRGRVYNTVRNCGYGADEKPKMDDDGARWGLGP